MTDRFYAGIGSRETPVDVLELMTRFARAAAADGWVLRSGRALGADQAFEKGAGEPAEIFLPWADFAPKWVSVARYVQPIPKPKAYEVSARHHPAWRHLGDGVRALHARNAHQILGRELDSPVGFVLCWTPGAKVIGGTAQALRIAAAYDIPIHNLADKITRAAIETQLAQK